MEKETVVAENKNHLMQIIEAEVQINGDGCDLNHIDVSHCTPLSRVF